MCNNQHRCNGFMYPIETSFIRYYNIYIMHGLMLKVSIVGVCLYVAMSMNNTHQNEGSFGIIINGNKYHQFHTLTKALLLSPHLTHSCFLFFFKY